VTTAAMEKQLSINCSECVSVVCLSYPDAVGMHRIIQSSMAYLALLHFSTLSRKRQNFWKKGVQNKLLFLIFSMTFV
jgi:hypothetical protein